MANERDRSLGKRTQERDKAKFTADQAKLVKKAGKEARADHKWDTQAYPNNPNNKAKSKELKRRKNPDSRVTTGTKRPKVGKDTVSALNPGGNGSGKGSNEVVIGVALASLSAAAIGFGGGEARAATPSSIQPTGAEQSNVHVMKEGLPRQGLLVDLSQKRGK
jgi:hypothetical protein